MQKNKVIKKFKDTDKETLKAIYQVKEVFEKSTVEEVKTRKEH